jgi:hypothetical protein
LQLDADSELTYLGTITRDPYELDKFGVRSAVHVVPSLSVSRLAKEATRDVSGNIYFDNAAGRMHVARLEYTSRAPAGAAGQDSGRTMLQSVRMLVKVEPEPGE